jgi:hypothetical protein
MAKRALQCPCTNRLRKTNLLQLFYTLVEDFKMKVMNKIAFSFIAFTLLSAAAQETATDTSKVLDQKR